MKKNNFDIIENEEDEINVLSEQLDDRDMFVLSYLKGFNRNSMKLWSKQGLANY